MSSKGSSLSFKLRYEFVFANMPAIFEGSWYGLGLALVAALFSLMAHFPCWRSSPQLSLLPIQHNLRSRNRTPLSPESLPYKHTPRTHGRILPARDTASASSGSKVESPGAFALFSFSLFLPSLSLSFSPFYPYTYCGQTGVL